MNFIEISKKYKEKNIIKLCEKLNKSCFFTKSKDIETLCELAYWLYIHGYEEDILGIYEFANIEIPIKINYNIWTWILYIWGLQAYIYENNGNITDKEKIITRIKSVYSVPRTVEQSKSEAWRFYEKIASRVTLESVFLQQHIQTAILGNDKKLELSYRFIALYKMISYGITGFYPELERNKEALKNNIIENVSLLKNFSPK